MFFNRIQRNKSNFSFKKLNSAETEGTENII